ncbi:MAG: arginine--tRNA ligase [Gammaproteobacteria bacterium]|nr:arginine--tRNA ligase [Gammaproteobacteria bacterium]MDE0280876.1 arginine--tRNA ligase [Gammaproteobacteria bacterium]
MKQRIASLVARSVEALRGTVSLPDGAEDRIQVDRTRDPAHGDYASNIALVLAKAAGMKPRDLAQRVVEGLPDCTLVEKVDIAGPGFINFTVTRDAWLDLIGQVRSLGGHYGHSEAGAGGRVMVEFVSANPTGPLHVGHGRGAAYGDSLVRVLRAAGYDARSEYYINDAGRQMDILALSVWLRYLELQGEETRFPTGGYRGDYVRDIARSLAGENGDGLVRPAASLFDDLPEEADPAMDTLVARCRSLLGDAGFRTVFDHACGVMVADIREDLAEFGVAFDCWFSERSLVTGGAMEKAIRVLEANGHVYEKDGAKWFRATDFGDEKDRVVVRANGAHTYFATDLAYHFDKGERGFDRILDIFGADHHGYVDRIRASFEALGHPREKLDILLVQFAVLYRGGEKVSMSTREGEFVTLRELRGEVGNDAARFFYALRRPEQHMDFDLDLAKSQSADNPVYYIQYAHARICSVFRQLRERGMETLETAAPNYGLLGESRELELLRTLSRYPEVVASAAASLEPHQVAYYLRDLATDFHTYYNAHPFLASENDLRLARLGLIDATRQVIANGLDLLGVSAPESM